LFLIYNFCLVSVTKTIITTTKKSNVLKLWKNGFTIDEGPLRSYEDPQNREFLESIQKGVLPRELIKEAHGAEVHMDMQDKRDEEYVPPKNQYRLYNDGYKLGSPTPNVVSNASADDMATNEQKAKQQLQLDESKPSTQIQIRLSNGSRLVIKANQTHKISDIRRYIST
jgi:UBX domain-containing protein 1